VCDGRITLSIEYRRRLYMNHNTKKLMTWLVFLVIATTMVALGSNKDRVGTSGAQELLIPVGARGVALGLSGPLFITGVDAIYWNPAGLSRMTNDVQAEFSQMSYIADIGVSYGAVGIHAGDMGFLGFSLKSISFGDIPLTTQQFPDGTGDFYSPAYITLGATYSKVLTDRIAVGVTGNLVSEKILQMSATGMTFDIGIQYRDLVLRGLQLAVAIKHMGPSMTFAGSNAYVNAEAQGTLRGTNPYVTEMASFDMPANLEIGLGYAPYLDEQNSLMFGGMFVNNNYLQDEFSMGVEYSYTKTFFARGAYRLSPDTQDDPAGEQGYIYNWSLGAGVHYDVGGAELSFDYAYRNVKYFSGSNVFTLMIGF
jgi:hypothetical protein